MEQQLNTVVLQDERRFNVALAELAQVKDEAAARKCENQSLSAELEKLRRELQLLHAALVDQARLEVRFPFSPSLPLSP